MGQLHDRADERAHGTDSQDVRAFLEHLTGPARGTVSWLHQDRLSARVGPDRILRFARANGDEDEADADFVARLSWEDGSYRIDASGAADVWVNRRKVNSARLSHGDMIEFGEHGPISRFRLCWNSFPVHWPVEEIVSDALAYARASRRPLVPRVSNAVRDTGRRIVHQTTILFRATVLISLVLLGGFGYVLYSNDTRFEETLQQEILRIEATAAAVAQVREDALTPRDLGELREELQSRLTINTERLTTLERRSEAPTRIIEDSARSVAFLQGAYGLRHVESGKLLRHVVGPDGQPLNTPFGQPWIDPDGTGDPAEIQFTGTGFLLEGEKQLVTNRHVAMPWTTGNRLETFQAGGLEPEILKLVAYFPGTTASFEAVLDRASESSDLAILHVEGAPGNGRGLEFAQTLPRAGDVVVLMGYPTGLRALLAQAGPDFLTKLEAAEEAGFWTIAQRLSEEGKIRPLASLGIVAQVSATAVVYDAETTMGGSGGPALDTYGRVVAVNAAILPEFGGSNIGVPVTELQNLLADTATQ